MGGRSMPEAAMMMVPEAWQKACVDAAGETRLLSVSFVFDGALGWPRHRLHFTDGTMIGATLDRNGLRPSRYYTTHDDKVIMASEVGVLSVSPGNVKHKGRLHPGLMFIIDFEQGRMIPDDEAKQKNGFKKTRMANGLRNRRLCSSGCQGRKRAAGFRDHLAAFEPNEKPFTVLIPILFWHACRLSVSPPKPCSSC